MTTYYVRRADDGQAWDAAEVSDMHDLCAPTDAAEKFAEDACNADAANYSDYGGGVLLEVKNAYTGEITQVEVFVESVPQFSSRIKKD